MVAHTGYGACTATVLELENRLGTTDFYLISKFGVTQTIPMALRYMPHSFCGLEPNILPVETTVIQIK